MESNADSVMSSQLTQIGKYRIDGVIGRGGMGVVYKAFDPVLEVSVAIKVIKGGADIKRFYAEARSTAALRDCPNIVTVYDFGEQDGNPYLVMQYLDGISLESIIHSRAALSLSEKLKIMIDVCSGLAYAHERNVIHRDVKPANIIILHDGLAKIVDFGIARVTGSTSQTVAGTIIGTLEYMSPENFQEHKLDSRTDVWSTGVVWYELLTGRSPFKDRDDLPPAQLISKIVNDAPISLSRYFPKYGAEFDAILERALAKDRDQRYGNMKEFAFDLVQVQQQLKEEAATQYFERAQEAVRREEWDKARQQLEEILKIDRQNTTANRLYVMVNEKIREKQRQERVQWLLAEAEQARVDKRYDDVVRILEEGAKTDPNNKDVRELLRMALDQKQRMATLGSLLERGKAALQKGMLEEAQKAAIESVNLAPEDTQARIFNSLVRKEMEARARHDQFRHFLEQAREQLKARDLGQALANIEAAREIEGDAPELLDVFRHAVTLRDQLKREAELKQLSAEIEAAFEAGDLRGVVERAEKGLQRFPKERTLLELQGIAKEQLAAEERKHYIAEQIALASSLLDSGEFARAVACLDVALEKIPGEATLEKLRGELQEKLTTEESQQRRISGARSTIEEARRLLAEQGTKQSLELLEGQKGKYSGIEEFDRLLEQIGKRSCAEDLQKSLIAEADPDRQVALAGEESQRNPKNEFVAQMLADCRERQKQINAYRRQATNFEVQKRFDKAIEQWESVRRLWPQGEQVQPEIDRLTTLKEEAERPRASSEQPPPTYDVTATSVMSMGTAAKAAAAKAPETQESAVPSVSHTEKVAARKETKGVTSPLPRTWVLVAIACALLAIGVVTYVYLNRPGLVVVHLQTEPTGAEVETDNQRCTAPCDLRLKPGEYKISGTREGFIRAERSISLGREPQSVTLTLEKIATAEIPKPSVPAGTLVVKTNVDQVDVLVDGKPMARTQGQTATVAIPAGNYIVSVKKFGYKGKTQQAEIAASQRSELAFVLEEEVNPDPYLNIVQARPHARVEVDGRYEGDVLSDGTFNFQMKPGQHRVTVSLNGYQSFSTTVSAKFGEKKSVPVILPALAPLIGSFTANPSTIQQGQFADLAWQVENATEIVIDHDIGHVPGERKQVSPSSTTTYTLTARNSDNQSVQKSVTISVTAAPKAKPVILFGASSNTIHQGDPVELTWATQNATEVTIDPIGPVQNPTEGSVTVSPSRDTAYTLIAKNADGVSERKQLRIAVAPREATPAKEDPDAKAILDLIQQRFKDAYESMSIDEERKVWVSMPADRMKADKGVFDTFKAVRLGLKCSNPTISGDKAACSCMQTITYTNRSGKVEPPRSATVVFQVKRVNGAWLVESMRGQ